MEILTNKISLEEEELGEEETLQSLGSRSRSRCWSSLGRSEEQRKHCQGETENNRLK